MSLGLRGVCVFDSERGFCFRDRERERERERRRERKIESAREIRLVANTGGVIMTTFDVFLSVLLPAPSPALPEAMAGATSMGGYLATARANQLVDVVR